MGFACKKDHTSTMTNKAIAINFLPLFSSLEIKIHLCKKLLDEKLCNTILFLVFQFVFIKMRFKFHEISFSPLKAFLFLRVLKSYYKLLANHIC